MVYRRIEPTPAEQLRELRKTRDHYVALAEQLHENTDPLLNPELKLAEERNARRIAHAYEKSVANSMVRMSSMEQTHKFALPSFRTRTWLMFFVAISAIEGALLLAYFRPALFQTGAAAPRPAVHRPDNVASLPPTPLPVTQAPPPIAIAPKPALHPPARPLIAIAPKLAAQQKPPPPIAVAPRPALQPQAPPPPIAVSPIPAAPNPGVQSPPRVATVLQPGGQPLPSIAPPAAPPPVDALAQPAPAAPPIATFVVAAPPVPVVPPPQAAAPVQPSTRLEPIVQTHSLPPYPAVALSLGEEGITRMRVAISIQGAVTDCEVVKSSGSPRLDTAACNYVQDHWRWNPPLRGGQPVTANTEVSVVWNLRSGR